MRKGSIAEVTDNRRTKFNHHGCIIINTLVVTATNWSKKTTQIALMQKLTYMQCH